MIRLCTIALSSLFLLSACASGTFKARQEQREKLAANSGLYCEFVNGDQHPDTDVELNMQMARRCDATGNFSIINYKNTSDQPGVMYCCTMPGHETKAQARRERMMQQQQRVPASVRQQVPAAKTADEPVTADTAE